MHGRRVGCTCRRPLPDRQRAARRARGGHRGRVPRRRAADAPGVHLDRRSPIRRRRTRARFMLRGVGSGHGGGRDPRARSRAQFRFASHACSCALLDGSRLLDVPCRPGFRIDLSPAPKSCPVGPDGQRKRSSAAPADALRDRAARPDVISSEPTQSSHQPQPHARRARSARKNVEVCGGA